MTLVGFLRQRWVWGKGKGRTSYNLFTDRGKHLTWELKARVLNGTQAACPALSTERHPRGQPDLAHGHSAFRAPVLTEWQGKTMSMGQTFCKKTYKNK